MARLPPAQVVAALVQRGVPEHVAQGVVMNFQDESGLDTGIQEGAPISGRGGFGLAQWTGPRRVALEQYAKSQGKPIDDLDLQLDYFMAENAGPEAAAWKQVMSAQNANDAAVQFVNKWERPASKYAQQRTAKYGGADAAALTSPYELRAQHPGKTTVGTGGYVAPGADTTQVPPAAQVADKEKEKDPYQTAISGALDAYASQKAPQAQNRPQPLLQAPMAAEAVPLLQQNMSRDQLAMLMQRLNSNTLVG